MMGTNNHGHRHEESSNHLPPIPILKKKTQNLKKKKIYQISIPKIKAFFFNYSAILNSLEPPTKIVLTGLKTS
jgi:hypothetical protein